MQCDMPWQDTSVQYDWISSRGYIQTSRASSRYTPIFGNRFVGEMIGEISASADSYLIGGTQEELGVDFTVKATVSDVAFRYVSHIMHVVSLELKK